MKVGIAQARPIRPWLIHWLSTQSVAKFMHGIDSAISRLAEIGSSYSMTVLMSNAVGQADCWDSLTAIGRGYLYSIQIPGK